MGVTTSLLTATPKRVTRASKTRRSLPASFAKDAEQAEHLPNAMAENAGVRRSSEMVSSTGIFPRTVYGVPEPSAQSAVIHRSARTRTAPTSAFASRTSTLPHTERSRLSGSALTLSVRSFSSPSKKTVSPTVSGRRRISHSPRSAVSASVSVSERTAIGRRVILAFIVTRRGPPRRQVTPSTVGTTCIRTPSPPGI